jgi:hypothetical protein
MTVILRDLSRKPADNLDVVPSRSKRKIIPTSLIRWVCDVFKPMTITGQVGRGILNLGNQTWEIELI